MASASQWNSAAADAMALQMDLHSSPHDDSSGDNHGEDTEEADYSPSLHKKKMLEREREKMLEREDFIRESAEVFESNADKKSKQCLSYFPKGELLE